MSLMPNNITFDQYRQLQQEDALAQQSLLSRQEQFQLDGTKFGLNMPTMKTGLQALGGLGELYFANKGLQQAKKQFEHQKSMDTKNLQNQTTTYNTEMRDRIDARAAMQGNMSAQQVNDYKRLNELKA